MLSTYSLLLLAVFYLQRAGVAAVLPVAASADAGALRDVPPPPPPGDGADAAAVGAALLGFFAYYGEGGFAWNAHVASVRVGAPLRRAALGGAWDTHHTGDPYETHLNTCRRVNPRSARTARAAFAAASARLRRAASPRDAADALLRRSTEPAPGAASVGVRVRMAPGVKRGSTHYGNHLGEQSGVIVKEDAVAFEVKAPDRKNYWFQKQELEVVQDSASSSRSQQQRAAAKAQGAQGAKGGAGGGGGTGAKARALRHAFLAGAMEWGEYAALLARLRARPPPPPAAAAAASRGEAMFPTMEARRTDAASQLCAPLPSRSCRGSRDAVERGGGRADAERRLVRGWEDGTTDSVTVAADPRRAAGDLPSGGDGGAAPRPAGRDAADTEHSETPETVARDDDGIARPHGRGRSD
eukprot:gene8941-11468_t